MSTDTPRLVKRMRRMAIAGYVYRLVRETFQKAGMPPPVMQPVTWRDDP